MSEGNMPRRLRRFERRGEDVSSFGGDKWGAEKNNESKGWGFGVSSVEKPQKRRGGDLNSAIQALPQSKSDEISETIYQQITSGGEIKKQSTKLVHNEVKKFRKEHNRYPKETELEEISGNIFDQIREEMAREEILKRDLEKKQRALKEMKDMGEGWKEDPVRGIGDGFETLDGREDSVKDRRDRRRRGRSGAQENPEDKKFPPKEDFLGTEKRPAHQEDAIKDLSVEGLFDEGNDDDLSLDELDKVGGGELGEEDLTLTDLEGDEHITKDVETDKNRCPKCKTRTDHIIFCSECGQGFCNHCARGIEVQDEDVKYTCPKCGKQFKVKKGKP
ncbi:MAG: hypothetical protein ABID38_04595 [Candidatus Diapherotrites archaeon]